MWPDTSWRAPAPAPQRVAASAAASRSAGVAGQPEVVVGAQQQDLAAVEHDLRPLRALDRAQVAVQRGVYVGQRTHWAV